MSAKMAFRRIVLNAQLVRVHQVRAHHQARLQARPRAHPRVRRVHRAPRVQVRLTMMTTTHGVIIHRLESVYLRRLRRQAHRLLRAPAARITRRSVSAIER